MAFKITDIGDQIKAIIRKQSAVILEAQADAIRSQMQDAAKQWQLDIRSALGVQVPRPWDNTTPRNLSKWPKRRTGALQRSVLRPRITWSSRDVEFIGKRGKATIGFTASDLYGVIALSGYGDTLDQMRDHKASPPYTDMGFKPFAGWKTRASSRLFTLLALASRA